MHQRAEVTDRCNVTDRRNPVPSRSGRWTRTLVILAIAAGTTRCATTLRPSPPATQPSASLTIRVEVAVGDEQRIQTMPLEDYVLGSVPAEMPLAEPSDAVADRLARLQAMVARTYALANRGPPRQ